MTIPRDRGHQWRRCTKDSFVSRALECAAFHALEYNDTWGPLRIGSSDILQKCEGGLTVHFHQSVLGEHIRKTLHFARARHDSIWLMLKDDASDKWFIKIKTLIFLMSHSVSVTLAGAICMQGISCAIYILYFSFTSQVTDTPHGHRHLYLLLCLSSPSRLWSILATLRNGALGCVWKIRRVRVMFYGLPAFIFFLQLQLRKTESSYGDDTIAPCTSIASRIFACALRTHISYFKNLTLFIRNLSFLCVYISITQRVLKINLFLSDAAAAPTEW